MKYERYEAFHIIFYVYQPGKHNYVTKTYWKRFLIFFNVCMIIFSYTLSPSIFLDRSDTHFEALELHQENYIAVGPTKKVTNCQSPYVI